MFGPTKLADCRSSLTYQSDIISLQSKTFLFGSSGPKLWGNAQQESRVLNAHPNHPKHPTLILYPNYYTSHRQDYYSGKFAYPLASMTYNFGSKLTQLKINRITFKYSVAKLEGKIYAAATWGGGN